MAGISILRTYLHPLSDAVTCPRSNSLCECLSLMYTFTLLDIETVKAPTEIGDTAES